MRIGKAQFHSADGQPLLRLETDSLANKQEVHHDHDC